MAKPIKLEANPEAHFQPRPDHRPAWLRHYIQNRHNYLCVITWQCKDFDRYDQAAQYLADLAEQFFGSPVVSQVSVYDPAFGDAQRARMRHAGLRDHYTRLNRPEPIDVSFLTYLRFTAVDYQAVQKEVQAHIDASFARMPAPDFLALCNSIYYIENHVLVRHEPYDVLSTAAGIAEQGTPGSNKCASVGFSMPSRDPFDEKTQVAYMDWYQEVRQHDSLRSNFPDEVGRMWLKISSDRPFDYWCLTTYEYCACDLDVIKKTTGAAYAAMNAYRGDTGGLYMPCFEATTLVIAEYMKPY